jgi:hypothetical protein
MPEDSASPSGGWKEVYGAMGVSTSAEGTVPPRPDCGEECPRIRTDRTGVRPTERSPWWDDPVVRGVARREKLPP